MAFTSALIGLGGMGTWHVENIQKKVSRIHVKGAFDVRPEALEKTGRLGIKPYGSLEELLADPEIDLVTIAIPNDMHKETAIRALRAGKHVVCEKPVTLNSAELEEIIAVQKSRGCLASSPSWRARCRAPEAPCTAGAATSATAAACFWTGASTCWIRSCSWIPRRS